MANGTATVKVTNLMPEFHLRQMHHDFIQKYKNAAKSTNKSLMHFMYQDLTGYRSSSVSSKWPKTKPRKPNSFQTEEPQVLLDLGKLNGNPKINKI